MAGLAELRQKGMRVLILDMQSNNGGFLDEAVLVADIFLAEGVIVSTRSRHKRDDRIYEAKPGDPGEDLPILVLVGHYTASAAEVVAGALQDHKRAKLIGTKTYGKGAVNKRFALNDASGILLTTGRYFLPSGRQIEGEGLTPDIPIPPLPRDTIEKLLDAGKPLPNPPRDVAVKLFQSELGQKGSSE
jgi:carboxyl-terminal processing protease